MTAIAVGMPMRLIGAVVLFLVLPPASVWPTERVTPYPPDWPHRAPWKLNRDLLLPDKEEILFLVDVVKGLEPRLEALDHLVKIASSYGEREASWVLLTSADAPRIDWRVPPEPINEPPEIIVHGPAVTGSVRIPQDIEDAVLHFSEIISCPDGSIVDGRSVVFVRYLGEWGPAYGATSTAAATPGCGRDRFPVIYVAQNRIARDRPPGWSRESLEKRDLVHEYGHLLNLGSNPLHGRWSDTISYQGAPHCVNPECATATPSARALLRGQMLDYCKQCQQDVVDAKNHWRTGREFPETARLPQPSVEDVVADLKSYQFRPGGEAERLVRFGKPAVPALMERMPDLPGGKHASPRAEAARLILKIIVAEDRKRRSHEGERSYRSPKHDQSQLLVQWWAKEGSAFLTGDSWALPTGVLYVTEQSR